MRGSEYGIMPEPLEAQKGLGMLIDHFLGEDWYVSMPMHTKQDCSRRNHQEESGFKEKNKRTFCRR